jgi:hypothetical protein
VVGLPQLARIFHAFASPVINTAALARCTDALGRRKLFQKFVTRGEKPLKRLANHRGPLHRAKAPVLMKAGGGVCEISGPGLPQRRFFEARWSGAFTQRGWFLNRIRLGRRSSHIVPTAVLG